MNNLYQVKDTVTGMLLGGIGHLDSKQKPNFLIVDASIIIISVINIEETAVEKIEAMFVEFTQRKDIAIILINQHVK